MTTPRCGIWREAPDSPLIAVVVTAGRPAGMTVPRGDPERWDWLTWLGNRYQDPELVIPESLLRTDRLGELALARGLPVWVAPDVLIAGVREVADLRGHVVAAMLARIPACRGWRAQLRKVVATQDPTQLRLL